MSNELDLYISLQIEVTPGQTIKTDPAQQQLMISKDHRQQPVPHLYEFACLYGRQKALAQGNFSNLCGNERWKTLNLVGVLPSALSGSDNLLSQSKIHNLAFRKTRSRVFSLEYKMLCSNWISAGHYTAISLLTPESSPPELSSHSQLRCRLLEPLTAGI